MGSYRDNNGKENLDYYNGLCRGYVGVTWGVYKDYIRIMEKWKLLYGWLSKLWSLFWVPIIIRHLILRVPQKGPVFLTTTHMVLRLGLH